VAKDRTAWQRGRPELVAPDVWRVPLPLPDQGLGAVNSYVVRDSGSLLVIDAGQANTAATELLVRALSELGLRLEQVERIVCTHVHHDHYSNGPGLRDASSALLAMGIGERPSLNILADPDRGRIEAVVELLRRGGAAGLAEQMAPVNAGNDMPVSVWRDPDEWLKDGADVILGERQLRVLATPGHTQGHVVLHDPSEGLLFTGDHVLPQITPSIGFEPVLSPAALGDFLGSLRGLLGRPDAIMLPAHGPAGGMVHARVRQLLNHHDERLALTLDQVNAGKDSLFAVAQGLPWTRRGLPLDELSPFNQALAVIETRAHLAYLVHCGRIQEATVDVFPDLGVAV
jgi:glyoxylase-like metal-dependent hydrolase (beta-lactamase superfamily II)